MDIPDISLYFLDRDFTDLPDKIWQAGYTALYFINAALAAKAAAFMFMGSDPAWGICVLSGLTPLIRGHPWPRTGKKSVLYRAGRVIRV